MIKALGNVKHYLNKSKKDNVNAIAAQAAFYIILSFIPFVMFCFSLLSLFLGNRTITIPEDTFSGNSIQKFLTDIVIEAINRASSGTTIVTAVISLWSAGRGLYIITDGITRIYSLPNKKLWLIKRIYAMGYTTIMLIVIIIIFAILTILILFGREMNSLMDNFLPEWTFSALTFILGQILLIIFMTLALKLYLRRRISDKRYTKFRVLLPGIILTVIGWNLLIFGVRIYTEYFAYSSIYGSMGTIIVLMMLVYFMMYALLFGIEINYIYRRKFYKFRFADMFKSKRKKAPAAKTEEAKSAEQ